MGGLCGARILRCGEGSAHKRGLFPQPHYRLQTEQTNERALVENLNWGWTVVNSLRGGIPDSLQTRPLWHSLTAHSLKFLLSATTEGVSTWRRGGGGGVKGHSIPMAPWFLFYVSEYRYLCRSRRA